MFSPGAAILSLSEGEGPQARTHHGRYFFPHRTFANSHLTDTRGPAPYSASDWLALNLTPLSPFS